MKLASTTDMLIVGLAFFFPPCGAAAQREP